MNRGFSPVLAHLLMAGLARRAMLSAATPLELRSGRDRLDGSLPIGNQSRTNGGTVGSYSPDALEWGIAAFLSGKAKLRGSLRQTPPDLPLSDNIKTIGDLAQKAPAFAESPAASAAWMPVPRS